MMLGGERLGDVRILSGNSLQTELWKLAKARPLFPTSSTKECGDQLSEAHGSGCPPTLSSSARMPPLR